LLASASDDKTVKLWDVATGVVLQTLEGYTSWVNAIVSSPNGRLLASASGDEVVQAVEHGHRAGTADAFAEEAELFRKYMELQSSILPR
jgi:hypothetical protein